MTHNLDTARQIFADSTDFTVGIEEEFAILDSERLDLAPSFDAILARARADSVLADSVAGELIQSEVEIRSGRGETFAAAVERQRECRARLFTVADDLGVALGSTGTHPWSDYRLQAFIDTPHYRLVTQELQYVAKRNNACSLHVHVGVRGFDRAIQVCDRVRVILPELLAISANSPFLDGLDTGLHSVRTETFTRVFPRCGIPDAFGNAASFVDYLEFLYRTNSIQEYTQVWWSIRPHLAFGTVEVRICDAQMRAEESEALTGLLVACVAQAARDVDAQRPFAQPPNRILEENLWRAIRYGLDGKLIDLERREEYPAAAVIERLTDWTAPTCAELSLDFQFPAQNGAQRQRSLLAEGASLAEVYELTVEQTRATYARQVLA